MSWLDRLAAKSIPPTRVTMVAYYLFVGVFFAICGGMQLMAPVTVMITAVVLTLLGWPVINIVYMLIKKRIRNNKKPD